MEFTAVCIAILLWLVRPQDWMYGLSGVAYMRYTMLAALWGIWNRPGGIHRPLFFQSPSDYVVIAYLLWIIYATGAWYDTAKELFPFAAFYYTVALALNTPKRLKTFLQCWIAGLCVVTVFALSPLYGMEFAEGSEELIRYFDGRLALNTWIFNNPNSLGHGVVVLIPLCYIWFWWRRPTLMRLLGIGIAWAAGFCVYSTQSKGAYLCGAGALGIVLLFRKRLIWQILIATLALTAGVAALKVLPRMNTLNANEDGIAGRLLIWQMAHDAMVTTRTGEGWKKFQAWIVFPDGGVYRKATHGSYVNVGADLGYPGLLLFVAIIYCNARTLLQSRPDEEDVVMVRCHRGLFVLASSYAASAWMIDRAYHTDFFIIAGAVAAFHRQMTGQASGVVPEEAPAFRPGEFLLKAPDEAAPSVPQAVEPAVPLPLLTSAGSGIEEPCGSEVATAQGAGSVALARRLPLVRAEAEAEKPSFKLPLTWTRLGILDLILIYLCFQAVLYIWLRIITSFIAI